MIIDETRNTLVIEKDDRELMIPKQGTELTMLLPVDSERPEKMVKIKLDAEKLIARPEDRVKRNDPKHRRK